MNIKQLKEKVRKGCGKCITNLICGETFCDMNLSDKKWLCNKCRAQLEILEELEQNLLGGETK